jgi:hypothetical protein
VHEFAGCFCIVRNDRYAAAIHTGPIRGWPNGLGGGQLSVFWTRQAGPVVLGRRRGMQGGTVDRREDWRTWPIHAVSGITPGATLVTSADVAEPAVEPIPKSEPAVVRLQGKIPAGKEGPPLGYCRTFTLGPTQVTVHSAVTGNGSLRFRELYETVAIFLGEAGLRKQTPLRIQFLAGDRWQEATDKPLEGVQAVRVERHTGRMRIALDKPRRVQLSPSEWLDGYQTQAMCRTVLIDLLEGADPAQPFAGASIETTFSVEE